jgi:hypothetical protein
MNNSAVEHSERSALSPSDAITLQKADPTSTPIANNSAGIRPMRMATLMIARLLGPGVAVPMK